MRTLIRTIASTVIVLSLLTGCVYVSQEERGQTSTAPR